MVARRETAAEIAPGATVGEAIGPGERPSVAMLLDAFEGTLMDSDVGGFSTQSFPARAAITVLGELGVTDVAVRVALGRRVERGQLTRSRRGREAIYSITEAGMSAVLANGMRFRTSRPFDVHQAIWTIVGFSIPERRRPMRIRLRQELQAAGFRSLRDGMWVAMGNEAWAAVEEALPQEVIDGGDLDVFVGRAHRASNLAQLVSRAWDVDPIRAEHDRFLARWEHADPAAERALPAFVLLAADWRRLLNADPGLPPEAGESWPSARSAATAHRLLSTLEGPAGARLAALAEADAT
jgi:DNA-binding transcriptional regulator PaaX